MKTGNMKYMDAAREAWFVWKDSGKEPNHDKAVDIVKRELGQQSERALLGIRKPKSGELNARISFLVWDLTQNGRGALDYDDHTGFIKNLLAQAGEIVSGAYARASMKIGKRHISVGKTLGTRRRGRVRMQEATQTEREEAAEQFIFVAKTQILRWKSIAGFDWSFVRRTLVRLCKEARAEWKKAA